jgi:hypothetical protein
MTKEESSLEALWLQNIRTMDKIQIIDCNNTAPLEMDNHLLNQQVLAISKHRKNTEMHHSHFLHLLSTHITFVVPTPFLFWTT